MSSFDTVINGIFAPISEALMAVVFYAPTLYQSGDHVVKLPLVLIWLVAAAVFFTFYLGFINLRGLRHSFQVMDGRYDHPDDPGQVSRFRIFSTELSGTVGLGNIAGVAVAISIGGPGAVVWMFLCAFFGMSTKFAEAALGVKYRHITDEGEIMGGPMYYLREGFTERGMPRLGAFMGALFAVCCIGGSFGGGNIFQANQAHAILVQVTGGTEASFWADKGWMFGLILAFAVGIVILGGIRSIAAVAGKIVPLMAGIYILGCLGVILTNASAIPAAFKTILVEGLTLKAGFGGLLGAMTMGIQRAAFSNEAGLGSCAIARAATKTGRPVSEGFMGMLSPVVDTMIICMMTGLVITVTGVYEGSQGMAGVSLTSRSFETVFPWFPDVLAVSVILFAYSTMLAWSYYGAQAFAYLAGEKIWLERVYYVAFCLFCIVGAASDLTAAIGFTDAMMFVMAVPNIIGLYLLAPKLRKELKEYWAGRKDLPIYDAAGKRIG